MKIATVLSAAVLMCALTAPAPAEDRILWYSIGDSLGSTSNMDAALNFAQANNFNAICILARYRADAMYVPNRDFSTYPNNEPRRFANVDTVQYIIDRAHERGMRVYAAWGCFLVTDGSNTYPAHLPAGSQTWVYQGSSTTYAPSPGFPRPQTTADASEGIWADPGRNDVQQHTRNVLLDFVQNYDIDGIILDRIRYPGDSLNRGDGAFGYNPQALTDMGVGNLPPNNFVNPRRDAITKFIAETGAAVHDLKPWVIWGAAPVVYSTTLNSTYNYVYQHFPSWNNRANPNHASGFGALDLIAPQYYRTTSSANASLMDLVNADINETSRMSHQAIFWSGLTPAADMARNICDQRGKNMTGFGIFSYGSASATGFMTTLRSTSTTCGTDVLASPSPLAQFTLKVGWDSIPPHNITDLRVSSTAPGRVRLDWSVPPPASDGQTPTKYLVYRSTTSPVRLYYENLVNRNFDITVPRFEDTTSTGLPQGVVHYRVVPVDSYNNKAISNQVSTTAVAEYIVESRGINSADYSEISGNWANSTSHSTAPGLTPGIGSRFATLTVANDVARFTPNLASFVPGTHEYEIFITSNSFGSTNCPSCTFRVRQANGTVHTGTFDYIASNTGNKWYSLGTYTLSSTNGAYLEIDSSTTPPAARTDANRIVGDAVKFVIRTTPSTTTQADGWMVK